MRGLEIYFVLLLPCLAHCLYDCIKQCTCEKRGEIIIADCKGRQFMEIPEPNPEFPVNILYLQFNRITRLRAGGFSLYSKLTELYIQGNRIEKIEDNAFDGLENLQKLDISKNRISHIPEDEFIKLRNLHWLSLSMNALLQIPPKISILNKLEDLDISTNNFIREIPEGALPSSLVNLDLRFTSIRNFEKKSFGGLTKLKKLLLSDNLASGSVQFGKGAFDGLISLEYMDMSRCFCKRLPSNSFAKLKYLKILHLNNCWLTQPPVFANPDSFISSESENRRKRDTGESEEGNSTRLETNEPNTLPPTSTSPTSTSITTNVWFNPQLYFLDLANNRKMPINENNVRFPPSLLDLRLGYTRISSIGENLFNETLDMQKLDLCHSKLKNIAKNAFMRFRNVSEICLSGNPFTLAPKLPSSLLALNLSGTKITNLTRAILTDLMNVKVADLKDGLINWIEEYAFENMTSMTKLDLSFNKLTTIHEHTLDIGISSSQNARKQSERKTMQRISSLTEINLSNNLLKKIDVGAFASHQTLENLNLQGNSLEEISTEIFQGLGKLTTLLISENNLINIEPQSFSALKSLEVLNLDHNYLEIIYSGTFHGLQNLKRLNLGENHLILIHPFTLPSLEFLDISSNNLTEFPKLQCENIREITASQNDINSFEIGAFDDKPELENLDLSQCTIESLNYSIFQGSPAIRILNLGYNSISQFLNWKMPQLEVLTINENLLSSIDVNIPSVAPNIEQLDLAYNNITYLNPQIFKKSRTLNELDLTGNNFQCICDLVPLVEWIELTLKTKKVDVVDAVTYLCEGPDEHYAEPMLEAVLELNCDKPSPPQPRRAEIYIVGICIGAGLVLISILIFLIACCRRSRHQRFTRDENSDAMLNQNGGTDVKISSKGCCFPCKKWCIDINSYKNDRGHRDRIVSEERRDLMISSPATSPTETEPPTPL